jgi:hypothetical protein
MRTTMKTTSRPVAAPVSQGATKVAAAQTPKAKAAPGRHGGEDVRPPGVARLGLLTRAKVRRAVAAALEGKIFEADA